MARAWDVQVSPPEAKVLLLKLADVADEDGCVRYRSLATFADLSGLDVRGVERGMFALTVAGLVKVARAGHYVLLLGGAGDGC